MEHQAQVKHEMALTLEAMFAAWNRGDIPSYTGFWSEDADLVNVLGMRRQGRGEILAELEFLHAGRFRGTRIRNLGSTVRVIAPDVVVVHVRWEMHGDQGQPGQEVHDGVRRGIFTHVAVRTPDGWRLAASQNTDIQPIPDFLRKHPTATSTTAA